MSVWNISQDISCIELPSPPDKLEICFPGGFCLSHIWTGIDKIPHIADQPLQFFGQIGPLLGALQPVFTIIDTVVALFKCLVAIPKAILSLNPSELFECLPNLVEIINKLLSMIPQLSAPRMVRQAIIAIARLLQGVASDLSFLNAQANRVLEAIDRAADLGDVRMSNLLACRQNTLNAQAQATGEAMQGIGRIVLLVNIIIGLFGGKVEIPCFGDSIDSSDLGGSIELLTDIAGVLLDIAEKIPDPQYILTLALGNTRC